MDMGNMEPELLFSKVDRYMQSAGSARVIFVLQNGKWKVETIGSYLLDYFDQKGIGKFCTAVLFDNLISYPLGNVINSAKDGRISITELCLKP